jgi:hypothetical protein
VTIISGQWADLALKAAETGGAGIDAEVIDTHAQADGQQTIVASGKRPVAQ